MCEPGRGLRAILCSLVAEWSKVSPVCPLGGEFSGDSCEGDRFASSFSSPFWNESTLLHANLPVRSILARAIVTLTKSGMFPLRKASTASIPTGPCKRFCILCVLMPYTFAPGASEEECQRDRGARGDGEMNGNANSTCAIQLLTLTIHRRQCVAGQNSPVGFSRSWAKQRHCQGLEYDVPASCAGRCEAHRQAVAHYHPGRTRRRRDSPSSPP